MAITVQTTKPDPLGCTTAAPLTVSSEVDPLRRVVVHRPGEELRRLTPANRAELLFDDVVWAERAAEEHDAFTDSLRARAIEVLYLEDLLVEALEIADARLALIADTIAALTLGPRFGPELSPWLESLAPADLARRVIAGVTFGELPFRSRSLVRLASRDEEFAIPPLPNHLFTRDPSSWAFGGVCVHTMATAARQRETLHFDLIYRHHPLFAAIAPPIWSDSFAADAALEGGDILVVGDRCVLVGLSQRSSPAAVESYAECLFRAGVAARVIVVTLPAARSAIHLDTVMTMVDRDAFTVFPSLIDAADTYSLTPSRAGVRVRHEPDLFQTLARALGVPRVRVIHSDADARTAQREQWDEGNNVLAVSPGVVVAYERNSAGNARLTEHGIEVITVPDSELSRGRGGPRCMTCPIERGELPSKSAPSHRPT